MWVSIKTASRAIAAWVCVILSLYSLKDADLCEDPHGKDNHIRGTLHLWLTFCGSRRYWYMVLNPRLKPAIQSKMSRLRSRTKKVRILKCSHLKPFLYVWLCVGRDPSRPAEIDICWQTARGWPYAEWLQHSERVDLTSCASFEGRREKEKEEELHYAQKNQAQKEEGDNWLINLSFVSHTCTTRSHWTHPGEASSLKVLQSGWHGKDPASQKRVPGTWVWGRHLHGSTLWPPVLWQMWTDLCLQEGR